MDICGAGVYATLLVMLQHPTPRSTISFMRHIGRLANAARQCATIPSAWRYSSLLLRNLGGLWEGYAEGGPREEVASNGAWRTGSKSGAGANHATRKIGVTVAATVVCRKGSGPTWHSRQQWSGPWCDSSWEASAKDWPSRVRHTSKSTSSVLTESDLPLRSKDTRILWLRGLMRSV